MLQGTASRQHIIEAFLQLCRVMPYNKITVSMLIKKAGYNRSTFYAHFKSIDALMQSLQDHVFQIAHDFLPQGLNVLRTGVVTDEVTKIIAENLKTNLSILAMLLGPHGDPLFVYKLKEYLKNEMISNFNLSPEKLTPEIILLIEFVTSGHLQVLLYCSKNNQHVSPLDFWLKINRFIDRKALFEELLKKSDKLS